ncbi:hypothetical protein [Tychonema sp. LEGE 06208]|uniref:hypothetical protein n=1 Tax=Tychonema sp. LEGE 06208 TaxID=1828663 RepID=UPI001882DF68
MVQISDRIEYNFSLRKLKNSTTDRTNIGPACTSDLRHRPGEPDNPAFSSYGSSASPSRHELALPVALGIALPTVQFKFGWSETFCGGFPSRLDLVLQCCAKGDRDCQNLEES